MFKPSMRHTSLCVALSALLFSGTAVSGEKDFKLPIKVDSKFQQVDGKTKTSIFRDDVHITQGTLKIDAEEVELIAGLGKDREVFIARGNPASYSQTMDDGSDISAEAKEIKYEVSTRTLTLSGNAELQQNSSMVTGESIVFNMELEQLIAQGTGENQGRVTTIFQPDSIRQLVGEDDEKDDNGSPESDKQDSQAKKDKQDKNKDK